MRASSNQPGFTSSFACVNKSGASGKVSFHGVISPVPVPGIGNGVLSTGLREKSMIPPGKIHKNLPRSSHYQGIRDSLSTTGNVLMTDINHIKKVIRQQKTTLRDRFKVKRIGVFGSYVRGDTHSGSDVDVVVEFSDTISLLKLVSLENYLSELLGIKVDVVPKEDIRIELRDRILGEAVFV